MEEAGMGRRPDDKGGAHVHGAVDDRVNDKVKVKVTLTRMDAGRRR
jgi:hypothetical protein